MKNPARAPVALFLGLFVFLSGCAAIKKEHTQIPQRQSNLTYGMVKKSLIEGQTTQAEVLDLLGGPNVITRNKSREEVWTYDRMSIATADTAAGIEANAGIPLGAVGTRLGGGIARADSSTRSKSTTLIITFDNNDVVKEYAVMAQEF